MYGRCLQVQICFGIQPHIGLLAPTTSIWRANYVYFVECLTRVSTCTSTVSIPQCGPCAAHGELPGCKQMCAAGVLEPQWGERWCGDGCRSTETIFWSAGRDKAATCAKRRTMDIYGAEAGVVIRPAACSVERGGCCLYIPGSVMHNSMPTAVARVHRDGCSATNKGAITRPSCESGLQVAVSL
jgi:hypothetical protein